MVKGDVILTPSPLQNPGYASSRLLSISQKKQPYMNLFWWLLTFQNCKILYVYAANQWCFVEEIRTAMPTSTHHMYNAY